MILSVKLCISIFDSAIKFKTLVCEVSVSALYMHLHVSMFHTGFLLGRGKNQSYETRAATNSSFWYPDIRLV